MLDFGSLAAQMDAMLAAQREWISPDAVGKTVRSLCTKCDDRGDFNGLVTLALKEKLPEGWHPAQLLDANAKLVASSPAPALGYPIRVCAADGSQIMPDAHEIAYCYLLHLSHIALLYDGTQSRAEMETEAALYHEKSDDEWHEEAAKHGGLPAKEFVEARRHIAELDALAQCLENAEETAIGFSDGILQLHPSAASAWRDFALAQNDRALDRLRASGHPVAAYIAASRAIDCVTGLRVVVNARESAGELEADAAARSREALARLNDVRLFDILLRVGERSSVFVPSRFRGDNSRHESCFFYLKLEEGDVARLEFPRWVADVPAWLDLVHAAARDQAERGDGYPIALMEAHEHAVVRGPERDAFFALLEELMMARGIAPNRSSKRRAKQRPIV
ncbi:MAG TPA: DNA double-strand break repair nuclease NurA [Abditibacteriaceae bacterium]|jgi:hypothetical protein